MKIVYCLHGTCNPGGMERIVIAKANALAERGHQVIIATTDQNGKPDFFPLSPLVRRLDSEILYSHNKTHNPVSKYLRRRKQIKRHKQFLAHLISAEEPDVVISTVGNEVNFIPEIAGGATTVAEIHFSRFYRLQKRRKGIWHLIDRYLTHTDRRALAKYDRFVVLTKADASHWKDARNLVVVPNFVATSPKSVSSLSQKRVIAVGNLNFQKNYDEMIEVWHQVHKSHPDWILEIYGTGPERGHLQSLIASKWPGENVYLRGTASPEGEIYTDASILLHTARYEGFPLALLEAMSAGVPVVAYDCPCGPSEIIDNNVTGFLIPQGDRAAMVEALNTLIEDKGLRMRMGEASVRRAAQFSPANIIEQWEKLLEGLINSKH